MPLNRYYIDAVLAVGEQMSLEDDEGHHLVRVTRASVGQHIELVDGKGSLAVAVIEALTKKGALLRICSCTYEAKPSNPLVLVQALPKSSRLDFIIEKATELGAMKIALFPGERSEREALSKQQWQRARSLAIAALKQCGRLYLPELVEWPSVGKWAPFDGVGYYGDTHPEAPLLGHCLQKPAPFQAIAFCVGPEGGLTDAEEGLLQAYRWRGVKLHANILRTETAPLVALSLLSHLL